MVKMGTRTRPRRWPKTLFFLCLTFLLQVDWSLGQTRNTFSPPSPPGPPAPPYRASRELDALSPSLSLPPPPSNGAFDPSSGPGSAPYIPPPPPPSFNPSGGYTPGFSPPTKKKSNLAGYIGAAVAAVIVIALVLVCGICCCKKRKTKTGRPPSNPPLIHAHHYDEEKASTDTSDSFYSPGEFKRATRYPYNEVYTATNGFTEVLGRGAFGVVYKGRLVDGTDVAVKKLLDRERGLIDFSAEVKTLGRINHANLVALRGFCFEQNQPYVIYEYVANGSLDKWIFQTKKENPGYVMPWRTRVSVLKGTAKGLTYLHEDLQVGQAIIHLDVKSENILLDEYFVPKVADFGLAKLLGSKMSKTLVAGGTMGYMAPEVVYGAASPKMDVYSFGVVLLEVLAGRRVMMPSLPADSMYLPAWAVRKVLQGRPLDVLDPLLKPAEVDEMEAVRLVMAALLCLQREADDRPDMSVVMRMIDGSIIPLEVPPALQSFLEMAERMIKRNYQQQPVGGGSSSTTSNLFSHSSQSNTQ